MTTILYHHIGACSLAPIIALHEAGVEHELRVINLAGDRTALLAVNPAGKVPALMIDGELLTENPAVLYRIAAMNPGAALFPTDPVEGSRIVSLLAWFSSTVHLMRRQLRMPVRFTPDADAQQKLIEAARPKMWELLVEMESRLGYGPWFGGERFSIADAYALIFYDWGIADGFTMTDLPRLTAWKERMLERPAVLAALRAGGGSLQAEVARRLE